MNPLEHLRERRRNARFARRFGLSKADRAKAAAIAEFYLIDTAPAPVNGRGTEGPR